MNFDLWEERLAKINVAIRWIDRNHFTTYHYYKDGKPLATILPDQSIIVHNKKLLTLRKGKRVDRVLIELTAGSKEAILDDVRYKKAWHDNTVFNTKLIQDKEEFKHEFIVAVLDDIGIPRFHPKLQKILKEIDKHCLYFDLQKFHQAVKDVTAKMI